VRSVLKQQRPEDHGKRIAELQREVENVMDAIAAGQLRGSPALANRLTTADAELERLQARQSIQPVAIVVPDVRKRFLVVNQLDKRLAAGPEHGRAALREVLGERVTLQPDASGRFLWAKYSLGLARLLLGAGASADLKVAGPLLRLEEDEIVVELR
jgi:hypothetical protein